MRSFLATLGVALLVGVLPVTASAKPPVMTAGGQTIAGPGQAVVAGGATVTVVRGLTDVSSSLNGVCATVVNVGKAPVRLDLIDGGTTSVTIPAGSSSTLCGDGSVDQVDLVCTGNKGCLADYRVDQTY